MVLYKYRVLSPFRYPAVRSGNYYTCSPLPEMLKSSYTKDLIEAGCDEAGRGCLAGPVVAAAVVLPKKFKHRWLNDSKVLTTTQRNDLRVEIIEHAIAWAIGEVSNTEIDDINILNASFLAMHRALEKLEVMPQMVLVDGNRFKPFQNIPHQCIVKGDSIFLSIAAASILAKTYRDDLMTRFSLDYPGYKWETNMGYPTQEHRVGIMQLGLTPLHRRSFQQLPNQMDLFED